MNLARSIKPVLPIAFATIWTATLAFAQPPQPPAAQPAKPAIGSLSLQNASLTEVIDQLARQLHLNYILDPTVKGGVILNTYGDTSNLDARKLLDLILRINGAAMVQEGDIYRIVQTKDLGMLPMRPETANLNNIPEDDQPMLNLIFLKYVTVDELVKVLDEFKGENATIRTYTPANLLFVLDSRRNMRRLMEIISLFDSDNFANQRVKLLDVKNARPSDLVKELENILRSISLDNKTGTVRFLPVDRINILIAIAPNPGVFDTVEQWLKKLDVPVKISAGNVENHVYRVRYGRSDCLAMALRQLFGISGGNGGYPGSYGNSYGAPGASSYSGGYGGYPSAGSGYGGYAGGYGNTPSAFGGAGFNNPGGYGNANNFSGGFGGAGACGAYASFGGGGGTPAYGYPAFGGYAAQAAAVPNLTGQVLGAPAAAPAAAGPIAGTGAANVEQGPPPPRIVPNPLDNALIIQADAQQYQNILSLLKDLDVPPRQILLEAKIYEVDLNDSFASGINYFFQQRSGTYRKPTASLNGGTALFSVGTLVDNGRELLAMLSLNEFASQAHMISEPSLIATDSIPASINVGTQVPVSTGNTVIPTGGNVATVSSISSESTGVTMEVNARINPSGMVTLMINQEISGISASVQSSLGTPAFDQQTVQTQITMQDGDTIAIGGTIKDTVSNSTNGIPWLSKLPGVGGLFGSKSLSHARTELIIFVTPHVIYDETNLIDASDELKSRMKKLGKLIKEL